jgi:hypothetical protein
MLLQFQKEMEKRESPSTMDLEAIHLMRVLTGKVEGSGM